MSCQIGNGLDTACSPMALLQRLFQLEGQDVMQDMLAEVLSSRPADGRGEQGWRRVIRVPASCMPDPQEELPTLQPSSRRHMGTGMAFAALAQSAVIDGDVPAEFVEEFSRVSPSSPHSRLQLQTAWCHTPAPVPCLQSRGNAQAATSTCAVS